MSSVLIWACDHRFEAILFNETVVKTTYTTSRHWHISEVIEVLCNESANKTESEKKVYRDE